MIAACRLLKETDCSHYCMPFYSNEVFKKTYEEVINALPHRSEWETPAFDINLQPPHITKRQAGRPRENNRILSAGEEPTRTYCSRCKTYGHHRDRCSAPASSQSKSNKSSKKTAKQQPDPVLWTPKSSKILFTKLHARRLIWGISNVGKLFVL